MFIPPLLPWFYYLGVAAVMLLMCVVLVGLIWLLKLFLDEKTDPLRNMSGLEAPFFEPLFARVISASPSQHNQWVKEFGRTFKFNGFGKFDYRLVTMDIRPLTHILNSPIYEKPWQTQKILSSFLGRGISLMEGAEHARQRKVVAPAFSTSNVRRLYAPIFVEKATELRDTWHDMVTLDTQTVIDVVHWTGRATMDVFGLAAFDHNFNGIQHENEEIYMAYKQMFDEVNRGVTPRYLLELHVPWIAKFWPSRLFQAIQQSLRVIHHFGNTVVNNRKRLALYESSQAFHGSDTKQPICNTDLLSRLIMPDPVDANTDLSLPASERLTTQDLLDQINTFLFAGSDSTSLGIAWCLFFLSCNSSIQDRLRDELRPTPLASTNEAHASHIDALPFLEKVVKETLRLSPSVHSTIRVATQNDIIPLSEPLALRDGGVTHEVKIRKGTFVHIPLEGFNTSTEVWGSDATVFKWDNLPPAAKAHPGLAGLLTFSFGGHACPGWKFALLEMKIFVASLTANFVFSPADEIDRTNILLQRPFIKGKLELGPTLPLNVAPYTP